MKELAGRLTALDPDAGAAVRVIAYFDRLAESRAGLEALVRGAAVLAGCPARLVDADRRVQVRVEADGTRRDADGPPEPAWPSVTVAPGGAATLWLECAGEPGVVHAVILERAAGAVRVVLDRTRGRAPADDPALVETVLDASAPERARLHAARRLGLPSGAAARVLAPLDGPPRIVPAGPAGTPGTEPGPGTDRARALSAPPAPGPSADRWAAAPHAETQAPRLRPFSDPQLPAGRLGVGPAVPVRDLPRSWAAARTALRFTAEGSTRDPGPRVVHADELGGVALLADLVTPGSEPPPDARALETAATATPWLLATLDAVVSTASLRAAAAEINVHHSTLQERLAHAEGLLGWPVRTPQGRLRLQLALTMRRLARPLPPEHGVAGP